LQVADSVKHLVAHGCDLLTARLAEGEARGGGGGSGITAGSSMLMRRGSGVGSGSLPIPRPPPPAAATGLSSCVFTHGFCPYVTALLLRAAQQTHFTLVVAEESPTGTGHKTAEALLSAGVPVRMIEFGAIARSIAQCQLVLVGADAVLADGGILAKVGTLTMAHAAHAHGRPFYVAAPHHVFSNTHHLDATAQTATRGVPGRGRHKLILVEQPTQDATPPSLVTLLLTDVGVLTPSAVADEMMQRQLR
jgi:translation initiation factor eIF-2B subunit alpha